MKPPVAESALKIAGHVVILECFFGALGRFKSQTVILMMRLKLRDKHKERLVVRLLLDVFDGVIVYRVGSVALEVKAFAVAVKYIAVVAVRGEFKHVGGSPIVIAAPALLGGRLSFKVVLLIGGKVPFADIRCVIARLAQIICERFAVCRQGNIVAVAACLRCVYAALQAGAHRPADGLAGEGILKHRAFLGYGVEIRRNGQPLTVAARGIRPLLI